MSLPEVEILLATYNGERFLREQIDSLLAQDYENIRVLARDDGSSDGTVEILQQYAERVPDRFQLMPASPATGPFASRMTTGLPCRIRKRPIAPAQRR